MRRLLLTAFLALALVTAFVSARQRAIRVPSPPPQASGVTFNKEVVRLFQQNCQSCHHPGDIAPFSLMTYREARPYVQLIKEKVLSHEMPPWKPVDGCGDFDAARVLDQKDIDTIVQWVDRGAPEGINADLPPQLVFDSGWVLGQPDLVLTN